MKRSNIQKISLISGYGRLSNKFRKSANRSTGFVLISFFILAGIFATGAVMDEIRTVSEHELKNTLNLGIQNTPPQVLKDLSIPAELWDFWQNQNIRLEPGEVRFARAPAQTLQRLNRRWNEDFEMERALHEHGNWSEIRSTSIGDVLYIQPRSGMFRNLAVKQEEPETPGFQRWIYYQYEDLSALGMDDHFIPRVAVEMASNGSSAYFVRLDPDGQSGIGHFGKSGWSVKNGNKILWIYSIPDTDQGAAIFSYQENGDTATGKIYSIDRQLLGELQYSKTSGAGSFMTPGQNEDLPVCWDSSMANIDC